MVTEFQGLRRGICALFGRQLRLSLLVLCLVIGGWAIAPPSFAADLTSSPIKASSEEPATELNASPDASTLFELNCAGCHANGGNIIRRGKNLKKKAMRRNGYESVNAIADIITNGKGIMSSYSDRLNVEEIGAIAQYVHEQSESGW